MYRSWWKAHRFTSIWLALCKSGIKRPLACVSELSWICHPGRLFCISKLWGGISSTCGCRVLRVTAVKLLACVNVLFELNCIAIEVPALQGYLTPVWYLAGCPFSPQSLARNEGFHLVCLKNIVGLLSLWMCLKWHLMETLDKINK